MSRTSTPLPLDTKVNKWTRIKVPCWLRENRHSGEGLECPQRAELDNGTSRR